MKASVVLNKKRRRSCRRKMGSEDWSRWSSLPADLVRRIADSFLTTDDVDRYMDFRAVCSNWRAATDDPKKHTSDVHFRPTWWIILDEDSQTKTGELLLLNTATGRFLRTKLPPLLDYYVVTTSSGGFFVLADRSPPHAARLFNPLTGAVTRFSAPVPRDAGVADVFTDNTMVFLLLLGDSSHTFSTASPDSQAFDSRTQEAYEFFRKMVVGGAYPHIFGTEFCGAIAELQNLLMSLHGDPAKFFSSDHPGDADDTRCFVLALATVMVLVVKTHGTLLLFNMDTGLGKLVPVESIGATFAIFIGHCRCLFVNASKFPGVEGNCVYYTEHQGSWAHICKYNVQGKEVERISDEAAEFLKQDRRFVLVADRPFTIVQLLCSYTINRRDSELVAATNVGVRQ